LSIYSPHSIHFTIGMGFGIYCRTIGGGSSTYIIGSGIFYSIVQFLHISVLLVHL
jgi:hypothetical protein